MDEEKNVREDPLDAAIKTILIIIFIFGLLIACFILYINSLVRRLGGDIEPAPTRATLDTEGWNSVDKDTMKAIRERYPHLDEPVETTTMNSYEEEAIKQLLDGIDQEQAQKRADDIRSVLERDRENDNNPDKSSDAAETISGTNQENE